MKHVTAILSLGMASLASSCIEAQPTTTRRDLSSCSVLSSYLDRRTGMTIVVTGGTPQPLALDWPAQANKVEGATREQRFTSLLTASHSTGLQRPALTSFWATC